LFNPTSIPLGGTTQLTITVTNPNAAGVPLLNVAVSDTLPAGLQFAPGGPATSTCATINFAANVFTMSAALLAGGASCSVTFPVRSTAAGTITNTTSVVTSTSTPQQGAVASADVFVFPSDSYQVSYAPNLNLADSVFNFTNTGANGAALNSGTSAAITGSICANVYAFSPDEQMIACCSCPVTPNGLVSLSARTDVISNTLTPAVPTSIVVKVLATQPQRGSCVGSASAASFENLAPGFAGWSTAVHPGALAGTFTSSELRFAPATLSPGELTRLASLCNLISANGSGFGICRSCRLGALGADQQ
jgi:uncharacterized repeat protein (TIGR01451 family)